MYLGLMGRPSVSGSSAFQTQKPSFESNCVATTIVRVLVVNFADVRSDWLVSRK